MDAQTLQGSQSQYDALHLWLQKHKPEFLTCLRGRPPFGERKTLALFSPWHDRYLYDHCPLAFVQRWLKDLYGGRP